MQPYKQQWYAGDQSGAYDAYYMYQPPPTPGSAPQPAPGSAAGYTTGYTPAYSTGQTYQAQQAGYNQPKPPQPAVPTYGQNQGYSYPNRHQGGPPQQHQQQQQRHPQQHHQQPQQKQQHHQQKQRHQQQHQLHQQQQPNVRPPLFYPTKSFVKSGETQEDNPVCLKLNDTAFFNKVKATYDKIEDTSKPGLIQVRLTLGTEVYQGSGSSLKAAKQSAAAKALAGTNYTKPPDRLSMKARNNSATSTQELMIQAAKRGIEVRFSFLEPKHFDLKKTGRLMKEELRGYYKVQLTFNDYTFLGEGDLPQIAKHNASTQALSVITQIPMMEPGLKKLAPNISIEDKTGLNAMATLPNGKNVVSFLNEIGMLQTSPVEWTFLGEDTSVGHRSFIWSVKLQDYESKGSGPNKKYAKIVAALNLYNTIPEEWKAERSKKKRKATTTEPEEPQAKVQLLDPNQRVVLPKPVAPKVAPALVISDEVHPVSGLHLYAKKMKLDDPVYEMISDTLDQANNSHVYEMKLSFNGKEYLACGYNKKGAKLSVATKAWAELKSTLIAS